MLSRMTGRAAVLGAVIDAGQNDMPPGRRQYEGQRTANSAMVAAGPSPGHDATNRAEQAAEDQQHVVGLKRDRKAHTAIRRRFQR